MKTMLNVELHDYEMINYQQLVQTQTGFCSSSQIHFQQKKEIKIIYFDNELYFVFFATFSFKYQYSNIQPSKYRLMPVFAVLRFQ